MHCHSPEVCFPAAGFMPIGESKDNELLWGRAKARADRAKAKADAEKAARDNATKPEAEKAKDGAAKDESVEAKDDMTTDEDKEKAVVRSGVYDSTAGLGQGMRYEAYYSLRHAGRWYPEAVYKTFRKEPAMYRLLLQRRVLASEKPAAPGNPSEKFLEALLPELERRIAEATQAPAPAPVAAR